MAKPEPAPPKASPADRTKPGVTPRVTLINAKAFQHKSMMQGSQCFHVQVMTPEAVGQSVRASLGTVSLDGVLEEYHDTRNYEKLTGHLNPVKILNLQKHLQSANILYN